MKKSTNSIIFRNKEYKFIDSQEIIWKFVYKKILDNEGWWGWSKRPGQESFSCLGIFSERELSKRLDLNLRELSDDDKLDLILFLKTWLN